jgi:hypothetical protein
MARQNEPATLESFDRFPPTVTRHEEYDDGVIDLIFLDEGDRENPRFARLYPGDEESELHL